MKPSELVDAIDEAFHPDWWRCAQRKHYEGDEGSASLFDLGCENFWRDLAKVRR